MFSLNVRVSEAGGHPDRRWGVQAVETCRLKVLWGGFALEYQNKICGFVRLLNTDPELINSMDLKSVLKNSEVMCR